MNTFYYKEAECSAGNLFKKDHVHIRLLTKKMKMVMCMQ